MSQDLKMSAGIAKQFRTVFAKGPELAIWLSYQYREGSYSILLLKGSVRYCLSFDNSGSIILGYFSTNHASLV